MKYQKESLYIHNIFIFAEFTYIFASNTCCSSLAHSTDFHVICKLHMTYGLLLLFAFAGIVSGYKWLGYKELYYMNLLAIIDCYFYVHIILV